VKSFNVITGVPRSGSTLLCNILNQNPEFYASSTSPITELLSTFVHQCSNTPEIQAWLADDSVGVTERLTNMTRKMLEEWYSHKSGVVFDKSRGWTFHALLLHQIFPEAKIIVCVRELRNVFASVEKHHRANPIFDSASSPLEKTVLDRADKMMSPEGRIGQSVVGLQDLMSRGSDRVYILQHEAFTIDPVTKMRELYDFIKEPYFEHDLTSIDNVSTDLDALYLNKFPHEGSGSVRKTDRNEWKNYLTPELGDLIYRRYPQYNTAFGY